MVRVLALSFSVTAGVTNRRATSKMASCPIQDNQAKVPIISDRFSAIGAIMDHVGALSAFVYAADARSFTVAGQRLGLSSSAIGKAITRLEERLGVRLFHRSTRTI